jgi:hypothetical protein
MREKFQYFRGDYESIVNDLDAIDRDNVLDDQSVDEMWNTFKSKYFLKINVTEEQIVCII